MSAFMVSEEHINVITHAAQQATSRNLSSRIEVRPHGGTITVFNLNHDPDKFAQALADANVDSLRARYGEKSTELGTYYAHTYRTPVHTTWSTVEVLKLMDCYDYQACEVPDYPDTVAGKLITQLRDILTSTLPGYQESPWAIGENSTPAAVNGG